MQEQSREFNNAAGARNIWTLCRLSPPTFTDSTSQPCRGQNTKMLSTIIRDLIFEQAISSDPSQIKQWPICLSRQILGQSVVVRSQGVHSSGKPKHTFKVFHFPTSLE